MARPYTLLVTVLVCFAQSVSWSKEPPNIVWIIAEDMSPDLGCYGCDYANTPNLDRLAAGGLLFQNAFVTGPACSPSRTALATGVMQTTCGAFHMRYPAKLRPTLPAPYKILPQLMRELGYYTGNVASIGAQKLRPKDDWLFQTGQKSWDTQNWQELVKRRPFFAQLQMADAHRDFGPADGTVASDRIQIPPYYPDHPVTREDWMGYIGAVQRVDQQVGRILRELKRNGLTDNTIIVFLSDHGRPMIRAKNWLYDSGTRIPLIVKLPPGIEAQRGATVPHLVSSLDLVAQTILWGGGTVPSWMQGQALVGSEKGPREFVFSAVDRIGDIESCSRAVRTERYKYIRNYKQPGSINRCTTAYRRAHHPLYHLVDLMNADGLLTTAQQQLVQPMPPEELYDLQVDPHETKNLADSSSHLAELKRCRAVLVDWLRTSNDQGLGEDAEEIQNAFAQYGRRTHQQQAGRIKRLRQRVAREYAADGKSTLPALDRE